MEKKKRTDIDFTKHIHVTNVFKNKQGKIRVDALKIKDSKMLRIVFTNTDEALTVTGDFGNYVFCRPFVPSKDGFVSDGYWLEKLKNESIQTFEDLDFDAIIEDLEEFIADEERSEEDREWYRELKEVAESEDNLDYFCKSFRDIYKPDSIGYEEIPFYKNIGRLNIIFDAFDEICKRLT